MTIVLFIAGLAKGKSVLDAYSYTGGFGILAAKAGAREVVCLDSSAPALALAEESAKANGVKIQAVKADVFEELERLNGAGETLRHRGGRSAAFREIEKGPGTGRQSLSQAGAAGGAGDRAGRLSADRVLFAQYSAGALSPPSAPPASSAPAASATLIRQAGAGPDHPVHPLLPESAYLKALVYALD